MSKIYLLCLIFLSGSNIFAQSRFAYSINSSYLFNNRIITKSESDLYKDYRNSKEKFLIGFNLEALIYYKINEKIDFETGVGYVKNGYEVKEERIIDPGFTSTTSGFYSDLYRYSFRNFYIPLHLTYHTNQKLNLNIDLGPSLLFPVSKNVEWILRKKDSKSNGQKKIVTGNVSDINKVNISLDFGLGLGYKLSDKFNIIIQPKVSFNMLGDENSDIRDNLYDISMFVHENKMTKEHLISYGLTLKLFYGL